jgi:hypothetical protein
MNTYSGKKERNKESDKRQRGRCKGWTGGINKGERENIIHLKFQ